MGMETGMDMLGRTRIALDLSMDAGIGSIWDIILGIDMCICMKWLKGIEFGCLEFTSYLGSESDLAKFYQIQTELAPLQ